MLPFTEGGASSSSATAAGHMDEEPKGPPDGPVPQQAASYKEAVIGTADRGPISSSDEAGEVSAARAKRSPTTPSAKEIDEHEVSHFPRRVWCRHCIAGSGRLDAKASVSQDTRDEGIDTVVCDYGTFNDMETEGEDMLEDAPLHSPVLFAKDRRFGKVFANVCEHKGVNQHAVQTFRDYLRRR